MMLLEEATFEAISEELSRRFTALIIVAAQQQNDQLMQEKLFFDGPHLIILGLLDRAHHTVQGVIDDQTEDDLNP